jgi:arylsulfatase A-like enzyme
MDVMPTIADILGVPVDGSINGRSLVPMMRGEEQAPRVATGGAVRAGPERKFVRWLGYKYIRVTDPESKEHPLDPPPPPMQLYDLRNDPSERTNLARKEADTVRNMMRILETTDKAGAGDDSLPEGMDETLKKRLESLGY